MELADAEVAGDLHLAIRKASLLLKYLHKDWSFAEVAVWSLLRSFYFWVDLRHSVVQFLFFA